MRATKTSARSYTLGKRAEKQAETRKRIVDATVELHSTVGPAATTLTMIAERAGVQRHTLYAHFPDDRSLSMACSAEAMRRYPPPRAEPWQEIADNAERLTAGLGEIYGYYERTEGLTGCLMRDIEHHDLTREIVKLRFDPYDAAYRRVLGEGLGKTARAMLELALSYFTWRSLVRDAGLTRDAAVAAMVRAIETAGAG